MLLIIAAFVGGFLARTLKLPSVLGYITSGIVFGILGKNFFTSYTSLVELSQIGVSLLLFTLGFEMSFEKIRRLTPTIILIGIGTVLATSVFILPWMLFLSLSIQTSILFAILFSFSSTAVIAKILDERGMLGDFPGTHIFIILLIQDLFVVPVIFFLPLLFSKVSVTPAALLQFTIAAAVPVAVFVAVFIASRFFLSKLLTFLFKYPSSEMQLLATIFIAAVSIGLFQAVGVPESIAAFLAGVIISEQGKNLATLSQIRPLRDLFLVLFFVMTGMLVSWQFVIAHIPEIIFLTLVVICVKFIIGSVLFKIARYYYKPAIFSSFELSNISEFAPVLGQIAFTSGFIVAASYNLLLSVFIATLLLTAIGNSYIDSIIRKIGMHRRIALLFGEDHNSMRSHDKEKLFDHVIICGHGRIGQEVRKLLDIAEISYVVIDYDHDVIRELVGLSKNAIYADPTDPEVLASAGVAGARGVIIAVPDHATQKKIIQAAKILNPKVFILCRMHQKEHYDSLISLGATDVVVPEFEAGIILGEKILRLYEVPKEKMLTYTKRIRTMNREEAGTTPT